jgi:N-acetylmuramoyl-L-alanine amidase
MKIKFLFISVLFWSCAVKTPYSETNKSYKIQAQKYAKLLSQYPLLDSIGMTQPKDWVGTTNFNMRKPNIVIIHHTAQNSCEQTLKTFTLPRTQVSAHYVICRDGVVHHMLNDYLRAWHGGVAKWGNVTDINSVSIGIELDNNGQEPFESAQIEALLVLLDRLKKAHGVPTANFIGHADIAPTRKNDPSVFFDWRTLAVKGFGLWYDDTSRIQLPLKFDTQQAFRIVGYDVRDTSAVISTFKRKFLKDDLSKTLNEGDKKILYSLMLKSM